MKYKCKQIRAKGIILVALLSLKSIVSFSQTNLKDEISIRVLKSRQVDNHSLVQSSQLKVKSDNLIKTMIKVKINVKGNIDTELSAFSLLDTVNKIRYRLGDYKGYVGFIGFPDYQPYSKTLILNKKGKKLYGTPPYDKNQKDYFPEYNFEGYKNFELPINFGTKKEPKLSIVYFGNPIYKMKYTAELFFTIINKFQGGGYSLYYKDEKVSDVKIKFRNY